MRIRIRQSGFKGLYVLGFAVIDGLLLKPPAPVPTLLPEPIADIVQPILLTAAVVFGARVFRGPDEDLAAPRAWWRATSRPAAGFWVGSVFVVVSFIDGLLFGNGTAAAVSHLLQVISSIAIAAFYANSSIQLVRSRRIAREDYRAAHPAPTTTPDGLPMPPSTFAAPAEVLEPPVPARPRALLAVCAAGAVVVVVVGGLTGFASIGFSSVKFAAAGQYQTVTPQSPVFSSPAHGFSIRFPGKPSVSTFANGDIDVTYRTGKSDYGLIAGTIPDIPSTVSPSADQLKEVYLQVMGELASPTRHITDKQATTVDGIPAEHAVITGSPVLPPWEYTVLICGAHIYQFNTYGLTASDARKFVDSMTLDGRSGDTCD
jgi:hypothetical protein